MAGALHLLFVLPSPSPSPTHPVASARRLLSAFTTSQQNAATTVDFASDESRRRHAAEQAAGHLELDLVLASWVEQHVHSMEETNTRTLLQLTSLSYINLFQRLRNRDIVAWFSQNKIPPRS